jgi:SPP1 gp7 family putative phage head morphogenesis protein
MAAAPLVAEKAMYEILRDEALRGEIRALIERRMRPIFRELYLGGVLAGIITARRERQRAGRKTQEDDDQFVELLADPAFAAREAMAISAYTNAWWEALDQTTRGELERAVLEAHRTGGRAADVAKRIEPMFGRARAQRIAVTETTRLFGAGAQASYRALGIQQWNWRTAEDERVCPDCDQMQAGSPYDMDQAFSPAHVGCRCWPVPVSSQQPSIIEGA